MDFGFKFSPSEVVTSTIDALRNEALAKIPGYSSMATLYRRVKARQGLTGPKQASNTVDDNEFYSAKRKIENEIGGTLNPFKWIWNLIQTILGNTKAERIAAAVQDFESYAHQYESYKFAHRAQEFLLTEIERRISSIESYGSKFVGAKNKKVEQDPVLTALKSAITSWLEPFNRIAHGEVQEIAKLTENDLKFIMNIRDRIRYSSKSRYIEDLLPEFEQAVAAAEQSVRRTKPALTPPANQRRVGEQLARQMGV